MVTSKLSKKDRVIVALDTSSLKAAQTLVKQLEGLVRVFKVGSELFTAHGWDAVRMIREGGAEVFLDLKFHDIPNTVSKAAAVACGRDILMFNVHALGGFEMMRKTREVVDERTRVGARRPLVLGVTILTSLAAEDLSRDLGITRKLDEEVLYLARLALKAGLDGVVSSPEEIHLLRKELGNDFVIVTPGIRPLGSKRGDQKRIFTPKEALDQGASYIVVGRPVTEASDPRKAVEEILRSIES